MPKACRVVGAEPCIAEVGVVEDGADRWDITGAGSGGGAAGDLGYQNRLTVGAVHIQLGRYVGVEASLLYARRIVDTELLVALDLNLSGRQTIYATWYQVRNGQKKAVPSGPGNRLTGGGSADASRRFSGKVPMFDTVPSFTKIVETLFPNGEGNDEYTAYVLGSASYMTLNTDPRAVRRQPLSRLFPE